MNRAGGRGVGPGGAAIPLIGLEQDQGMGDAAGRGCSLADEWAQAGAFLLS
jgi:hypothetical protein